MSESTTDMAAEEAGAAASSGLTIDDMLDPSVYPHAVRHLIKRETPISWVILTGEYAYKIKKPVRLDFVDATELTARRRMCENELTLNRRLAPDLYLEVVGITREGAPRAGGRARIGLGGPGEAIEYAVKMREFDELQMLASLLDHGGVSEAEIADLAQALADFHQRAPIARIAGKFPGTEHLQAAVLGNLATLMSHMSGPNGLADLGRLIDWTHDALHDLLPALRRREELGFVRDCHGDLHARNIVRWNGRLLPFDCLEFSPDLRTIDVMNDLAFLVMDLVAHQRMDLTLVLLNRYLEVTGDYDGLVLLSFYAVYRALVRAMVDAIDTASSPAAQSALHRKMCMRIATAARFASRASPALYLMHGLSGSGKSWLSERLVQPLQAIRIRSDVERKRLAGMPAHARAPSAIQSGIYDPASTHRTYARLLECAGACLHAGFNTIVDATFLHMEDRRMFEDFAGEHRFKMLIISCEADRAILAPRIKIRQQARNDYSDADLQVLAWQLEHGDSLDEPERAGAVTVHTDAADPLADAVEAIRRATVTP